MMVPSFDFRSWQAWIARRRLGSKAVMALKPPAPTHRIPYGADPNQFGALWLPAADDGPHPLLIFIHGGYWRARYDLEHASFLCQAFAQNGLAVWNVEYRRLGNPDGGYPGTFQDIVQAVSFARTLAETLPLDLQRVAVMGHSAGGHLALWVAGANLLPGDHPLYVPDPLPLRAAICLGGITDLRRAWELGLSDCVVEELLGGGPEQVPERYAATSPMERLPLGVPQIIVHGTDEEVVPTEFATRYAEAARGRGDDVSLVWLPGMGHFEPIDPLSPAWPVIHDVVARTLLSRSSG